jgi:tRNA (guanine-N7-)-methyltransferase
MIEKKNHRPIRSFVRRMGRTKPSQQKAFDRLWALWGRAVSAGALDIETTFGQKNKTILEIGFGMGQSLLEMAQQSPETNFIGIDVHRPGVSALLSGIEREGLSNLRLYQEDAIDVLNHCIADHSLDTVQLFFPDPWPKSRHHKRRLVQPTFIALLHQKLKSGGLIHFATDWAHYAHHMMAVLEASPDVKNLAGKDLFFTQPTARVQTKFERRALRLGHEIFDLCFLAK